MAAVLDRLDRPCPDPDIAAFRAALGIEGKVARGPHVLLLHQHSEAEAAERVAVLERVILGFHLLFAAQGVELQVPRRRLVSAWFGDREDYLAFLHRQGADAFATTGGYFHPTWGAVVAFDARSGDVQRAARRALARRRDELRRSAVLLDQMPARARVRLKLGDEPSRSVGRADGRALIDRLEREAAYRTALLDLDWRTSDLGLAAHEMVHQLVWDSGLVPRHDAFPYWLHEGFAAQFELIRGGRWAGISRANDLRLPDWRGLPSPAKLERLVRDVGFGRGYQRDLYAQAWALVYYLRTRHPSEFLTFLDLLRNPIAGPDSDEEALRRIEARTPRRGGLRGLPPGLRPGSGRPGTRLAPVHGRAFGRPWSSTAPRLGRPVRTEGRTARESRRTARQPAPNRTRPVANPAHDAIDRDAGIAKII